MPGRKTYDAGAHPLVQGLELQCPYCGEPFPLELDASEGAGEQVEDCGVCCRPVTVRWELAANGYTVAARALREDD